MYWVALICGDIELISHKVAFLFLGFEKMWGRCWCAGFGSLRKRVSSIVNISDGYREKLGPFDPSLLGLKGGVVGAVECGGGKGSRGLSSLSVVVLKQIRGISSSTLVASSDHGNSCGDGSGGVSVSNGKGTEDFISFSEAKKLLRLVNVETLKMRLGMEGKEVIPYSELLEACESIGIARSKEEAIAFAKVLDEAGVILLFRDKVYLHPDKVEWPPLLNCLCLCFGIAIEFVLVGLTKSMIRSKSIYLA